MTTRPVRIGLIGAGRMSFALAVCSEMVFTDLPLLERVERIHAAGFAVEIWDWTTKDAEALLATGASFTSMTGYVTGDLVTAAGADDLLRTAEQSIPFAQMIRCPSLNLHGTDRRGEPRGAHREVGAIPRRGPGCRCPRSLRARHRRGQLAIRRTRLGRGRLRRGRRDGGMASGDTGVALERFREAFTF